MCSGFMHLNIELAYSSQKNHKMTKGLNQKTLILFSVLIGQNEKQNKQNMYEKQHLKK